MLVNDYKLEIQFRKKPKIMSYLDIVYIWWPQVCTCAELNGHATIFFILLMLGCEEFTEILHTVTNSCIKLIICVTITVCYHCNSDVWKWPPYLDFSYLSGKRAWWPQFFFCQKFSLETRSTYKKFFASKNLWRRIFSNRHFF